MSKIKTYLLLVNPYSGDKQGIKISKKALSILNSNSIIPDIMYTDYQGHAKKICKELQYNQYSDLLIIGGDGTFSEVINGILSRNDQYSPCLGFITGGTGNSLMHNLNLLDPIKSLQPIIKNQKKTLDIIKISYKELTEFSFNIVGWGVATDIGRTAEKIRWLGSSRYTIASLYHILILKKRYAKLTINKSKKEKKFIFILVCNTQYTGTGMMAAPHAKLNDGLFDVIILNDKVTRLEMIKLLPKIFTGEHLHSKHIEYIQTDNLKLEPKYSEALNVDGEIKLSTPIILKLLPGALTYYRN